MDFVRSVDDGLRVAKIEVVEAADFIAQGTRLVGGRQIVEADFVVLGVDLEGDQDL